MSDLSAYSWSVRFLSLFDKCLDHYKRGNRNFSSYYSADDISYLNSIGYKPREFFDFVEDWGDGADLTPADALLVAAARRDYFLTVQNGKPSRQEIRTEDLPARDATLGGIPWLPRIIVKARAKLKGELNPDIMYACGGDRQFLTKFDIHPADFLRQVWAAGDDDDRILQYVKSRKH